jgi:hypothetical protein
MKRMKQTIEPHHFEQEARRIRTQVSTILTKWGLKPRFKRWRLTQDPDTGMIVLFGILNDSYIATHTSIPFNNYFDPRLLDDLAKNMQLQVVFCNSDGSLRYAFILDRGSLGKIPTHIDFPIVDNDKLVARVVYSDSLQSMPAPSVNTAMLDDHALVNQGVSAFLKVFDDIQLRDDAAQIAAQGLPEIVVIEEDEFNKRVAEHEANRQRINHIRQLLLGGNLVGGKLELSKKMQEAMLYAMVYGGKLCLYRGGFWAMENWRKGQHPWFGTSTVKALVSRGLMSYTEWQDSHNGRFPVAAAVISELLDV